MEDLASSRLPPLASRLPIDGAAAGSLSYPGWSTASSLLFDLIAFALPLVVYIRTLAPTIYGLDSAELTTGAYALGIVHAPGSPLFLLLGHVFTYLPVGDVGYRVNLMAACAAALAVWFAFRSLLHLTVPRSIALATAWLLAFSYYFWISAVAAELYALHACIMTGLLWLALVWRAQAKPWQLCLFTFACGLGLGNHLSLALLLPGYALLVLITPSQPWRRPRLLLAALITGLLGASVYLYLPIRYASDAPLNYARDYWRVNLASWDGFWWMVSGRMFRQFMGAAAGHLPTEALVYLRRLVSNFVGLGFVLGLCGLIGDFRRRPIVHTALLLMFVGHLSFFLSYGVIDKEVMFLPTYVIWALWTGIGAHVCMTALARRGGEAYVTVGPALLLLLALSSLVMNYRLVDLSSDWTARERGERIFAALEPNAAFLGSWMDVPILEYLQIVEHQRADVRLLNLIFMGGTSVNAARTELAAGRPVYTSALHLLDETLHYEQDDTCGCYRVSLPAAAPPLP